MSDPSRTLPSSPAKVPARVWGGTGLLVVGRLWSSACTLLTLFLLARHLEPEGFGRLTFYLALFLMLDSLADMGTGQIAVQWTAHRPERVHGVLRVTRRIRLVTGLTGTLLVGGGALLAGEPGAPWILLAGLYQLTHTLELSTLVFKNRIAWARPVAIRAVASSLSLGFVLLFWWRDVREPALYLLAIAMGSALGNLLLHVVGRAHLPRSGTEQISLRPLLRAALPIGIASLCQQTYFYVDNIFVRAFEGPAPLGHYNVAVRIMSYGIMVAVYASLAALPWLTRERDAGRLRAAAGRLARPMFALAGLGTGLLWPWCEELLALFGPGFSSAGPSLRWLLLATLAVYVGAVFLTAVVASGRSGAVLKIALAGLAVNLVGNALLVPALGLEGAAMATFATELTVALAAAACLRRSGQHVFSLSAAAGWAAGPVLFYVGLQLSNLFAP